jgi:hypothetical protein
MTMLSFANLRILNVFQINSYPTSLFMFRFNCIGNLPTTFENDFLTNDKIHQLQEIQSYTNNFIEQIVLIFLHK